MSGCATPDGRFWKNLFDGTSLQWPRVKAAASGRSTSSSSPSSVAGTRRCAAGDGTANAQTNPKRTYEPAAEIERLANSNRCLIPASAFFEFTGSKSPKTKHRFTLNDAPFMAIAGIWREQQGNQPPAFTMLTTAPGPDVEPIHNRQIAVLQPQDWKAWVYLAKPESELLRPLPAGSLRVETVRVGAG